MKTDTWFTIDLDMNIVVKYSPVRIYVKVKKPKKLLGFKFYLTDYTLNIHYMNGVLQKHKLYNIVIVKDLTGVDYTKNLIDLVVGVALYKELKK